MSEVKRTGVNIIAEETTTLPEGAILSVCRCTQKRGKSYLKLFALRDTKRVEMRLSESVGTATLPTLLKLIRREIERRRAVLTEKPKMPYSHPNTMYEFVMAMAYLDMFVFHDFNTPETNL